MDLRIDLAWECRINDAADKWSFVARAMGMKWKDDDETVPNGKL